MKSYTLSYIPAPQAHFGVVHRHISRSEHDGDILVVGKQPLQSKLAEPGYADLTRPFVIVLFIILSSLMNEFT